MQSSGIKENGTPAHKPAEAGMKTTGAASNFTREDAVTLKNGWIENLRRAIGLGNPSALKTAASFRERARVLADALLSERGEVLGTVIAHDLAHLIRTATPDELTEFAHLVAENYSPDKTRLTAAIDAWRDDPSGSNLTRLIDAVEPPRQELFRRINMAPGGTATLVGFRKFLLTQLAANPGLAQVDADLTHLFASWFNRGFLEMRRIDWHSSASVLEKLIAYEAVHAIAGWDDLRRRLASDRRCFAFFHPALPDDPLIFIEVALVNQLSARIDPIIHAPMPLPDDAGRPAAPSHAIFYSISNCQAGLRGVSFGNFLIKQVAADLARELPSLKIFSTLSPVPSLRKWVENADTPLDEHVSREMMERLRAAAPAETARESLMALSALAERNEAEDAIYRDVLLRLAARYVTGAQQPNGPRDPVARFHLGNGARVERINWDADRSPKGLQESFGIMVNYLYDLDSIEANHEAFANRRPVATSRPVAELADLAGNGRPRSLFRKG